MLRFDIFVVCFLVFFKITASAPYWGGHSTDDGKNDTWARKQIPSTNFLLNWILQLLYRSDYFTLMNYNANRGVWNINAVPNKGEVSSSSDSKSTSKPNDGRQSSNLDGDLVMVRDKENDQLPTSTKLPSTKVPSLTIIRDYDDKTSAAPSTKKISDLDIPVIILTGNSAEKIQEGSTKPIPELSTVRDYGGDSITNIKSTPSVTAEERSVDSTANPTTREGKVPSIPLIAVTQTSTSSLNMIRFTDEQTTKAANQDNLRTVRDRDESKTTGLNTTPALLVVRDKVAEETTGTTSPQDSFIFIPKVTVKPETTTKSTSTSTTTTAASTTSHSGLSVLGPSDILSMLG